MIVCFYAWFLIQLQFFYHFHFISLLLMDPVHFRPTWEGGQYDGDERKRLDALRLAIELGADYIDVELQVSFS